MTVGTMTKTATYTVADVENVVRRLKADLLMIADSTGLWTPKKAADYVHDVEELAKKDYLAWVDLTLLDYLGREVRAVRYDVTTNAASVTTSRPGGVLWPRTDGGNLRIIIGYTGSYDDAARKAMSGKLRIGWSPTSADTSHSSLNQQGARDYSSNAFGMKRKDWEK